MRNQNLDVIAICKGMYDQDKYDTRFSALKAYYMREYAMEEKFTNDFYILKVILMPVISEYLTNSELCSLTLDLFSTQFDIKKGFYHPVEGYDTALKFIIESIIAKITVLRVLDDADNKIIDLTEYSKAVV